MSKRRKREKGVRWEEREREGGRVTREIEKVKDLGSFTNTDLAYITSMLFAQLHPGTLNPPASWIG
jgi:hypothetical protein